MNAFLPLIVELLPIGRMSTPHGRFRVAPDSTLLIEMGDEACVAERGPAAVYPWDRWESVEWNDTITMNPRLADARRHGFVNVWAGWASAPSRTEGVRGSDEANASGAAPAPQTTKAPTA